MASGPILQISELPVAEPPVDSASAASVSWRSHLLAGLLLAVGLVAWSLLRIPIPGVSEPHYLGKAKHFWDPLWCPGDFFLDSSNPHLVFYATIGWISQFTSLWTTAIIGRILGLTIVAIGWQKLARALAGSAWGGLWALPVFLMLHALGNWSGEWLIGGIEGKVFAYGFLFWAIAAVLEGQGVAAAMTAGLAVSFHPVVGAWGVIAAAMASGWIWTRNHRRTPANSTNASSSMELRSLHQTPFRWKSLGVAAGLFVLCALPGLIPAFATLRVSDPQIDRIATQLQVGYRLKHHLDPMALSKEAYRDFLLTLVIWILLLRGLPIDSRQKWWRAFIWSSLVIAFVGILLGWGPRPIDAMPGHLWRMKLLKFYPFRLADLLLPVAVSIAAAQWMLNWFSALSNSSPGRPGFRRTVWPAAAAAGIYLASIWIPGTDSHPSRLTPAQQSDWREVCHWLRENSDSAAIVQALDTNWGLRWFADRPEYVSYKDFPQDAVAIVEWNRRLWVLANWKTAALADGTVSPAELAEFRKQSGAGWLLVERFGPVDASPAYSNASFRVYELPAL